MFIFRDLSERFLLSVYWEQKQLFVVVKEVLAGGELKERSAVRYDRWAAHEFISEISNSGNQFHGVQVDPLTMLAVIGRIAEGLKGLNHRSGNSRLNPEMWN